MDVSMQRDFRHGLLWHLGSEPQLSTLPRLQPCPHREPSRAGNGVVHESYRSP